MLAIAVLQIRDARRDTGAFPVVKIMSFKWVSGSQTDIHANNATIPASTPAAPSTSSDPLICICPFAVFVLLALVAAALASLLDLLTELVMNPVDRTLPVPVSSGVTVPLNIVTPVAECKDVGAVMGPWAVGDCVTSVGLPSLSVETLFEKGESVRSFASASTSPPSASVTCIRYPLPQFCMVFGGMVNEPLDVLTPDASVC